MRLSLLFIALALAACGDNKPDAATPSTPSSAPSAASADTPAASATAAPARARKPFDLFNSCADVVTIAFGDDLKTAGKRTIAPSSTIDGPRDADGNQVVTLVDGNGERLAQVHVTRGMKRVEVGRSCLTLDAH